MRSKGSAQAVPPGTRRTVAKICAIVPFEFTDKKSIGHTFQRLGEICRGPWTVQNVQMRQGALTCIMDKFRTLAAIIGMTAIGPVIFGFFVVCLIKGEFPVRHSTLTAAEHPLLFYPIIVMLLFGGFKASQISVMFAIGYFRGRSKR
jgi:hypothetical protein